MCVNKNCLCDKYLSVANFNKKKKKVRNLSGFTKVVEHSQTT